MCCLVHDALYVPDSVRSNVYEQSGLSREIDALAHAHLHVAVRWQRAQDAALSLCGQVLG
eukprot:601247-Pelagomonas_calceolata.AAC.1